MATPRLVIEQSPWQGFFESLPGLLAQYGAGMQQQEWQSNERALDRAFEIEKVNLTAAAEDYRFLRGQKATWENLLIEKGYNLPEYTVTQGGGELFGATSEGYEEKTSVLESNMEQLSRSLSSIADAQDFAKEQADQYGDIIKAGEDEAWKDYLLEGGLQLGPEGEIVGTGEMAEWLKVQTPETMEKLKGANYRRALLGGLRTIEEAKNLEAIDLQMSTAKLSLEATRLNIAKNEFEYSVAQLNEFDKQTGDIYKNTALSTKANFRYVADGIAYSITDLFSTAATDIDDFIDIKQGFLEDSSNYAIAHEAEAFISGIQQAAASGMDDSEFVVKFQKGAYDNYMQLQNNLMTLYK